MTRVAAVDCGTNSVRLLVADLAAGGASGMPRAGVTADGTAGPGSVLTDVLRRMEIVRLGQDVDRTGRLAPDAIERTRRALAGYAEQVRGLGVERVRMVATSATRDAANRHEFRSMVRGTLGVEPEVISGQEEAALSFTGAVRELVGGDHTDAPYLVADIGGGSTELVLGTSTVEAAVSMEVGCVRLTERHLCGDPPSADQIAAVERDIRDAVRAARTTVPVERACTLVGLAGSVTTVAALALGLTSYDAARIHHSRIRADAVRAVTRRLLSMTHQERTALPVMHPGRGDVIGAGALILRVLLDEVGAAEVVVSEHDILDGIAWSLA